MKTTFLMLACLVFLAAPALGDEEDFQISSRALPSDLTNAEQACIGKSANKNPTLVQPINECINYNIGKGKSTCIKKIVLLADCFRKPMQKPSS
jgi:hypothetical protein